MTITHPDTESVVLAIQSMIRSITIEPIDGNTGYKTVSFEGIKDVTDLLPLCEITASDDETERESMNNIGGSIDVSDEQWFDLTSTVDYTNAQQAGILLFRLRDKLTKLFHDSARLNDTPGVIGVYIQKPGRYGYAFRNGSWYRMHQIKLKVLYWYETTLQS